MTGRPQYENAESRADEEAFAAVAEKLWNVQLRKLPIAYGLDFAALRGVEVKSLIEFKRRHRTFDQYDTTFLSAQKVMAAQRLAGATGLPTLFVVKFDDKFAYVNILSVIWRFEFRGRTDRGDWQDEEPVAVIPMSDFVVLKLPEEVS